jgi:hypothetical protein
VSGGPPYVQQIYPKTYIIFDTNVSGEGRVGLHVEFDENYLWTVKFTFTRKPGNTNELSVHIAYPGGDFPPTGEEWTVFWTCNDSHPENPHLVQNKKFDNEDIFVWAEWKKIFNPADPYGWHNCVDMTQSISPDEGKTATMTFYNNDRTSQIDVTMTRGPQAP